MAIKALVPISLTKLLPDAKDARLPAAYEGAKRALSVCERVDECKDWSDKAVALASYARQAKDETLLRTAVRIQTRAITRAGELFEQIEPKHTGRIRGGGSPNSDTRKAAAEAAGFSDDQRKNALRAARFKAGNPAQYEELVESDNPPTPTQLSRLGQHRNEDHTAGQFQAATKFLGAIARLREFLQEDTLGEVVSGLGTTAELLRAESDTAACVDRLKQILRRIEWELKHDSTKRSNPRIKK